MMQGDSYRLPIQVTMNGEVVTLTMVEDVEVMLGSIRKTLYDGSVSYDDTQEAYLVSLSQEDTFRLRGGANVQVRVKFLSGDVLGVDLGYVDIKSSASKVVL